MDESIVEAVSLRLLERMDDRLQHHRNRSAYAMAAGFKPSVICRLEEKLVNGNIRINLATIARLAMPFGLIPFVLFDRGAVDDLGAPGLLAPEQYRAYFQTFFARNAEGYSHSALARALADTSGIPFTDVTVFNYRQSRSFPNVLRLEAVSRFFDREPDYLVDPATIHI